MTRKPGSSSSSQTKRPPLTHFVSIPLVTEQSRPQLERSLSRFRQRVSNDDNHARPDQRSLEDIHRSNAEKGTIKKIDPRALRPTGSIHLTIGVMSLDQPRLNAAIELLETLDLLQMLRDAELPATGGPTNNKDESLPSRSSDIEPLRIDLKGLESMHEPSSTSILYIAPYDDSSRLYNFCLALQKIFKDHEYLINDHRDLKLHATVVKTSYAKTRKQTAHARSETPKAGQSGASNGKIDARDLLREFADYVWAENIILDRIAICEMGARKCLDGQGHVVDEIYNEIAITQLPGIENFGGR